MDEWPPLLRHLIANHFFLEYYKIANRLAAKFYLIPHFNDGLLRLMRNTWIDTLKDKKFDVYLDQAWHVLLSDFAPILCSCDCIHFTARNVALDGPIRVNQNLLLTYPAQYVGLQYLYERHLFLLVALYIQNYNTNILFPQRFPEAQFGRNLEDNLAHLKADPAIASRYAELLRLPLSL